MIGRGVIAGGAQLFGESLLVKSAGQSVAVWIMAAVGFVAVRPATACNVPVFRYALERWAPDPYEVVIFHRGPLSKAEESIVREFESRAMAESGFANFVVRLADVTSPEDDGDLALLDEEGGSQLPWMVVQYPTVAKVKATVWAGRWTETAIKLLVDSPLRQEMGKRLVGGHSAVWVFVESGDSGKDDAAAEVLNGELAGMAERIEGTEIPGTGNPTDTLEDATKVPLSFSTIRVSREDERERIFLNMLLRSEADLESLDEPMAFPVFGRGRALYALVGAGINADTIQEACAFLTGPCSCQVKTENPGVDLLMQVAWEEEVKQIWTDETLDTPIVSTEAVPSLVGQFDETADDRDEQAGSPIATSGGGEAGPDASISAVMRNLLIGLIVAACGAAVATAVVIGKTKKQTERASTS
jgi:hypothetical protein